jgi:hypothetical protein
MTDVLAELEDVIHDEIWMISCLLNYFAATTVN